MTQSEHKRDFTTCFRRPDMQKFKNSAAAERLQLSGVYPDTYALPRRALLSRNGLEQTKWDRNIRVPRNLLMRRVSESNGSSSIEEQLRSAEAEDRETRERYGRFVFKRIHANNVLSDKYTQFGSGAVITFSKPESYDVSYKLGGSRYPIGKGDFNAIHHRLRPGQVDRLKYLDGSNVRSLA